MITPSFPPVYMLRGTAADGAVYGLADKNLRFLMATMRELGGDLRLMLGDVVLARTEPDGSGGWRVVDLGWGSLR